MLSCSANRDDLDLFDMGDNNVPHAILLTFDKVNTF